MDKNPATSLGKLNALTSFRFFAAALIVLAHSHAVFNLSGINKTFQLTQGVSFFFVLSGFILAYNYDTQQNKPRRAFYVARFARIWPAHVVALGIYFVIVQNPFQAATTVDMRAVTFASNLLLIQSWVPTEGFVFSYNGVAWSLSTELGFYLLFFVLIRRRPGALPWKALCICAALAGLFVGLAAFFELPLSSKPFSPSLIGVVLANPLARLFEFSLGIFACAIYRRLNHIAAVPWVALEVFALLLVGFSMWLCSDANLAHIESPAILNYIVWTGSAPAFFFLILVFACSKGPFARLLSLRPFVFLGEISFCLYLVHQPIVTSMAQNIPPPLSPAYFGLYSVISLASAYVLFSFIEKPARRWIIANLRAPTGPKRWRWRAPAAPGMFDTSDP